MIDREFRDKGGTSLIGISRDALPEACGVKFGFVEELKSMTLGSEARVACGYSAVNDDKTKSMIQSE